jgi:hypothetical protein
MGTACDDKQRSKFNTQVIELNIGEFQLAAVALQLRQRVLRPNQSGIGRGHRLEQRRRRHVERPPQVRVIFVRRGGGRSILPCPSAANVLHERSQAAVAGPRPAASDAVPNR